MTEVRRYMINLGLPWQGGERFERVVLATDYDALAARVQAVEREAVQIHHRGECRIAQDYYEEMNRLQDKLTASEQDAARLREALQVLYDEQNDAPLENRRQQWQAAMTLASDALRETGV